MIIVALDCAHLTKKLYKLAVVFYLKPGFIAYKPIIQCSGYLNADIYSSAAHVRVFDICRFNYIGLV